VALELLNDHIRSLIQEQIVGAFKMGNENDAVEAIPHCLAALYAAIPEKKRLSYGRYTTIKVLAQELFKQIEVDKLSALDFGGQITNLSEDHGGVGVGLGVLALYGLDDYPSVLPYFKAVAQADHWELREHAQGLFRKVVKAHRDEIKGTLFEWVQSDNPNLRRFVSECLRPVVENQWLYKDINYSLSSENQNPTQEHPQATT